MDTQPNKIENTKWTAATVPRRAGRHSRRRSAVKDSFTFNFALIITWIFRHVMHKLEAAAS